jgi:hypothetical protein
MTPALRRLGLGLATAGTLAASAATGQDAPRARVTLERIRSAWCLDFLAEPDEVARLMPKGWTGAPATAVPDIPAPFRITMEENPRYAAWVPSRICLVAFGAVSVNGDETDDDSERKPMALAWWQVSAHPDSGTTVAPLITMLASNSYKVRNPLGRLGLALDDMGFEMGPNAKSQDPTQNGFQVKLAGATLFWKGYLSIDSTLGTGRRTFEASVGNQTRPWSASGWMEVAGASRVAGVVGVMGKSDLGKLLDQSPIRIMSPVGTGGTGDFSFDRMD